MNPTDHHLFFHPSLTGSLSSLYNARRYYTADGVRIRGEDRGDMEKMEKSWPNAACFPRSSWGLFEGLSRSNYGMDVDEHDGAVGFLISDPVDSFYVAQYLSF